MLTQNDNILKLNQNLKSDKTPCIVYADLVTLIDNCKSNQEKSPTTKIGESIPCRYSTSTIWTFGNIENKHSFYVFLYKSMQQM